MLELCGAVTVLLYMVSGLLLRYAPFASVTTRRQKRVLLVLYAVAVVVNILVMVTVFRRYGISIAFIKSDGVIFAAATALINIWVIPRRTREHLFVFGIVITANYLLLSVPAFVAGAITGIDRAENYLLSVAIYGALLLLTYWPLRTLLRNTVEPFLYLDSGNYWRTVWFIPVALFFDMYIAFPGNDLVDSINHLVSRGLTGAAMVLMCLSIAATQKGLREKQIMEEQLTAQKLHYAELQIRVEEIRKINHDFKHHIAAIRHYMATDDKEGLRNYCDDLVEGSSVRGPIPYTGNNAVDGVLYHYMQLAEQNQIHFQCSGTIHSHGIPDVDLCALLGNALDNAVTACLTIQDGRSISVVSQTERQLLSVMIRNSFDGRVNQSRGTLLSRKRENRPGVGISSMRSICERHGGSLELQWDESTFTVMFVLPLQDNP